MPASKQYTTTGHQRPGAGVRAGAVRFRRRVGRQAAPPHRRYVNGTGVRGVAETLGSGQAFIIGLAWRRDRGVEAGDVVEVSIHAEGPQRDELAPDVAAACGPSLLPATSSTPSRSST